MEEQIDVAGAFRLTGKVAIVTGGAGGIGAASATVLAGAGATVVVVDLDGDGAEAVAKAITNSGGNAVAKKVDVADKAALDALVDETVAEFGAVDLLHNNAGIMLRTPLLEVTPEEFDTMLSVNLKSVLYGTQAVARVMKPGSAIVNTLSTIIDFSTRGTGSYAATKKGAEALTRTFAVELGALGIRVNAIAPGWVDSGMTRSKSVDEAGDFDQTAFDALADKMAAAAPLTGGTDAVDQAFAVLYLSSPASRGVTGHVVRVNGGMSMA
jgi:NAD(P)-dependent dehydrogenase (short-subunit alcohol dehydrogenase family)